MRTAGATAIFDVIDPNGMIIGEGAVGTTFSGAIKFAIASANPTLFVVGDRFLITVLRHEGADDLYYPATPRRPTARNTRRRSRSIRLRPARPRPRSPA